MLVDPRALPQYDTMGTSVDPSQRYRSRLRYLIAHQELPKLQPAALPESAARAADLQFEQHRLADRGDLRRLAGPLHTQANHHAATRTRESLVVLGVLGDP